MSRLRWNDLNPVVSYANVLQCEPGFRFGPRRITNHQFIYVAMGKGNCRIGGRRYEAAPGDLFYYGPGVVHRFEADQEQPFLLYGLHFGWTGSLEESDRFFEIVAATEREADAEQANETIIGQRGKDELRLGDKVNVGENEAVSELLAAIVKAYRSDWEKDWLVERGLFIQLLNELHRRSRSEQASLSPHERIVFEVRDKLKRQAEKPYDRSWLSSWTGYHADYLSRLYRERLGESPHEYHLRCKLNKSKELLEHTDLTAGEIAERLGFASPHYFSRVFRQKTGMTPLTFRQHTRMV